jgi:hypothetical protein
MKVVGFVLAVATVVAADAGYAGTRTYVSLAGRDESIPKLGKPGIAVTVLAGTPGDRDVVAAELARELAAQVHTRRLSAGEPGDYELTVTIATPGVDGDAATIPFTAELMSAAGARLWRIDGRSDVEGAPLDASVYAGIGRNVVSALIHDGWLQPRYDPDDPPPAAPHVR